jgi:hypothetical protein
MILIRVVVGLVFLTEGILKFVHPEQLGAASFLICWPRWWAASRSPAALQSF